jgi:SAM-dependent methyltransferase
MWTIMTEKPSTPEFRTRARPRCQLCKQDSELLHAELEDPLFGIPGRWAIRRCNNTACRLHWVDPVVMPEDLALLYKHYYTHGGDGAVMSRSSPLSGRPDSSPLRRAMLALVFGYAAPSLARATWWLGRLLALHPYLRERLGRSILWLKAAERGRLLDVGCGAGELLGHLSELGWEVVGIEPDPDAAAQARKRGVDVRVGNLDDAPFPAMSFDVVSLVHVIEHVPDPLATLRHVHELLRPGGKVILVTPSVSSLGARIFGPAWRGWEVPRHLHLGDPELWARLAAEVGFTVITKRTCAIGAGRVHARSAAIRRGDHRLGLNPNEAPDYGFRLASRLFEGYEHLLTAWPWRRPVGEEVILVARRKA